MPLVHRELTSKIISCFYKVYNTLGYGFLERVYENAMRVELERQGLAVAAQVPIKVHYEGVVVGDYLADLCVENTVIVELKAASKLEKAHEAQLMNYLRATGMEVGLLLNFGPKAEFSRKVHTRRLDQPDADSADQLQREPNTDRSV